MKFKKYCEATFFQERNVILENAQIGMIRVLEKLVNAVSNSNGPKYVKALASVMNVLKHFKVAKLIASLAIHEILQENPKLSDQKEV